MDSTQYRVWQREWFYETLAWLTEKCLAHSLVHRQKSVLIKEAMLI
jgi:hypothetical protein